MEARTLYENALKTYVLTMTQLLQSISFVYDTLNYHDVVLLFSLYSFPLLLILLLLIFGRLFLSLSLPPSFLLVHFISPIIPSFSIPFLFLPSSLFLPLSSSYFLFLFLFLILFSSSSTTSTSSESSPSPLTTALLSTQVSSLTRRATHQCGSHTPRSRRYVRLSDSTIM